MYQLTLTMPNSLGHYYLVSIFISVQALLFSIYLINVFSMDKVEKARYDFFFLILHLWELAGQSCQMELR